MQPLPRKQASASGGEGVKRSAEMAELSKLREEVKALRASANSSSKGGGKGKNTAQSAPKKSKGKGGHDKLPNLPAELRAYGNLMVRYKERPICYGYNMRSGCSKAVNNINECPKGKHICMKCGGDHPVYYAGCPKTTPPL
jgi:hypothetical protein